MNHLRLLVRAFIQTLYPPFCLHCDHPLGDANLLCEECQQLLELIEGGKRCSYCFTDDLSPKMRVCQQCLKRPQSLSGVAAVFDDQGPPFDLVRHFKKGKSYLAKGLAGYLAMQWASLNWPLPDLIVPVAGSFSRWLQRGVNPRVLLAQELGHILKCPVIKALRRTSYQTQPPTFRLRSKGEIEDKTLLLVDDLYVTGKTLNKAAEALITGSPAKIYGLTVGRTMA